MFLLKVNNEQTRSLSDCADAFSVVFFGAKRVFDFPTLFIRKSSQASTTLWANSADDNFMLFFISPGKLGLTFHADCLCLLSRHSMKINK